MKAQRKIKKNKDWLKRKTLKRNILNLQTNILRETSVANTVKEKSVNTIIIKIDITIRILI